MYFLKTASFMAVSPHKSPLTVKYLEYYKSGIINLTNQGEIGHVTTTKA
jgi:hypothetical protein